MYIGRWVGLNKVVPLCAMEGDRLSVGIAPLIFKLGSRRMWVVKLSALANLLPEKKAVVGSWLGAGARVDILEKR